MTGTAASKFLSDFAERNAGTPTLGARSENQARTYPGWWFRWRLCGAEAGKTAAASRRSAGDAGHTGELFPVYPDAAGGCRRRTRVKRDHQSLAPTTQASEELRGNDRSHRSRNAARHGVSCLRRPHSRVILRPTHSGARWRSLARARPNRLLVRESCTAVVLAYLKEPLPLLLQRGSSKFALVRVD